MIKSPQRALDDIFSSLGAEDPPAKEEMRPQGRTAAQKRISDIDWEDPGWYRDLIPDRYGPHTILKVARQIYERGVGKKSRL